MMIRIQLEVGLGYEIDEHGTDLVFNIHAAHTASQPVTNETLFVSQSISSRF